MPPSVTNRRIASHRIGSSERRIGDPSSVVGLVALPLASRGRAPWLEGAEMPFLKGWGRVKGQVLIAVGLSFADRNADPS